MLKDWKKYREKYNSVSWFNRKKSLGISVVKFINSKEWSFVLEGKEIKTFKTKSQALKYAKSYMRSN